MGDEELVGTPGERLAVLGERVKRIDEKLRELADQMAETLRLVSSFADLKPEVLLIMQQAYQAEADDKREFYKTLKTATITVVGAVIAVLVDYFLTHHGF